MDMHLLASIYDIKGNKKNTMKVCKKILADYPDDIHAKETIKRFMMDMDFSETNMEVCNFFIKASSRDELMELERWLIEY